MTKVAVVRQPLVHRDGGCAAAGRIRPAEQVDLRFLARINAPVVHAVPLPSCRECGRTVGQAHYPLCLDCVLRRDP